MTRLQQATIRSSRRIRTRTNGGRIPLRTLPTLSFLILLGTFAGGCIDTSLTAPTDSDLTDSAPTDPDPKNSDPGDSDPLGDTNGATELAAVRECASPDPAWIWCDDFEQDRLAAYFEYSDQGGSFVPVDGVGVGGSRGMRARFRAGQVEAGGLRLAFGRTPQLQFRAVDAGTADYREVYWRIYLRHEPGWIGGGGDKLSRATSLISSSSWAQAMIAHVWSGEGSRADVLAIDPASGTDPYGTIRTTTYNDFDNLRWLGSIHGSTPLFDREHVGAWYCIEAHVRLNDPGSENGVFEVWIDGEREVAADGLNWLGTYSGYGINAVFLENYWNAGAPQTQERYFDGFVVSTERIGC